jgi:cytoskeletal protein CcmA (bactofilin family)
VREERRVAAWIGASIVIEGSLTSSEDLTIAGRVHGDVTVREHTVVIAPQGRIDGNIVAHSVAVNGDVKGAIRADQKLEIGETGSVDGDITTPRLVVAEGAVLKGRVGVGMPT